MRYQLRNAAFLVVGSAVFALGGLFTALVTAPLLPDDFAIYMTAIAHAWAGADAYHPFGIGASFVYPPTALAILWPLHALPSPISRMVWAALTVVLFLYALSVAWSAIEPDDRIIDASREADKPGRRRIYVSQVVLAALVYAPFVETVVVGQTNVLVVLGMVLFVARKRLRPWVGEAGLAFAIGLKLTPLLLLAVPLARRDWRSLSRAAVLCLALVGLSIALFGTEPWRNFWDIVPRLAAGDDSGSNQAAAVLLAKAVSRMGAPPPIPGLIGGLVPVCLVGWFLRAAFTASPQATVATELFGVSVVTTASSIVWYHHLTLLAPVLLSVAAVRVHGRRLMPVLVGLALIQIDRVWEVVTAGPPVAATAGSLAVVYAAWQLSTAASPRQ